METTLSDRAIDSVAELATKASEPISITESGRRLVFSRHTGQRYDVEPRLPQPLVFKTLDGLVGFLRRDWQHQAHLPLVHVQSPMQVIVHGPLIGTDSHLRAQYAMAVAEPAEVEYGTFLNMEVFQIGLQTCFAPELGAISELRRFTASVRSAESRTVADDGVSQQVEAKAGVAAVMQATVTNPWSLAPYRTFAEVKQPESFFVLRFKQKEDLLGAGLWETGDTRWKVEAVTAIARYLRTSLDASWADHVIA